MVMKETDYSEVQHSLSATASLISAAGGCHCSNEAKGCSLEKDEHLSANPDKYVLISHLS